MIEMHLRACAAVIVIALAGCAYVPDFGPSKPKAPAAQDFRALREEAISAYAAEDWPRAAAAYRELVAAIPSDASYWYRLGTAEARAGNTEQAVQALQRAMAKDPTITDALYIIGLSQLRYSEDAFSKFIENGARDDPDVLRAQAVLDVLSPALRSIADDAGPADR